MANVIKRIPYADKKRLKELPGEAQLILDYTKNKLPKNDYKNLENLFIDLVRNKEEKPVLTEKSSYEGPLQNISSYLIDTIGLYNPDCIPIQIYERMSKDSTIALGLSVIRFTIAGLGYMIDCEDQELRSIISKLISKIYRPTVLSLTDAVRLGFAVGEKVWKYDNCKIVEIDEDGNKEVIYNDDLWMYEKIKFVYPGSVKIRIDEKGNFLGITQENLRTGNVVKVNSKKLVLYSHNMEYGNWFGNSRLSNVYPSWYWGMVLTHFMLKYYERKGQPLTIVKAPPGTRTDNNNNKIDNITHALKIGQAAMSNSVIALPMELSKDGSGKELWTFEYIKDDQRGEMFIQILDFMDSRKLRGLFIPDKMGLASDGSPHSASGSSAGDSLDVFIMTEQALANDIEYIFNTQIIPDLLKYNFKQESIIEVSLKIEKLDYNKKLLMKDVLLRMIMLSAGSLRDGRIPRTLPSLKKIAEILDLPMDKFDDLFKELELNNEPPSVIPENTGGNDNMPTIDKKIKEDNNNVNRSTDRKERSTRDRSIREKKR